MASFSKDLVLYSHACKKREKTHMSVAGGQVAKVGGWILVVKLFGSRVTTGHVEHCCFPALFFPIWCSATSTGWCVPQGGGEKKLHQQPQKVLFCGCWCNFFFTAPCTSKRLFWRRCTTPLHKLIGGGLWSSTVVKKSVF